MATAQPPISSPLLEARFADSLFLNKALFCDVSTERDLDLPLSALATVAKEHYKEDIREFLTALKQVRKHADPKTRVLLKQYMLCTILTQHKSAVGAGAVEVAKRSCPKLATFVDLVRAFTNQIGMKHLNMAAYVRMCQMTYMTL